MKKIKSLLQSRWIKGSLIVIVSLFMLAFIGYITILYGGKLIVKEEDLILPATTTIETIDGNVIGELFEERRYPVLIEDIPEHVQQAFVAIEDRRFYTHSGVDIRSVFRALYRDIVAGSKVEGASTITQQLAKNLFLEQDKTWMRKTKEVMAAIYLERKLSKKEILELYVNKIYYGGGLHGIEAASQYFFSKSVKDLSLTEGALLAGIIQAPNYYFPEKHPERALYRRNVVLQAMERSDYISTETRIQAQGKTLGLHITKKKKNHRYDSYIDLVIKEAKEKHNLSEKELKRGGYRIIVNLNETFQQISYEWFQKDDYFPGNTAGVEGAFIMLQQGTGRIVSVLGGRTYTLGDLNRVTVKRQPGSTMKPLVVYGPAMMEGTYHPYTLLPDQKREYNGHEVSNIDDQYLGSVSMYEAIIQSKNAPSAWLFNELGPKRAKTYLEKMNIDIQEEGISVALGGLLEGLSPLEMAKAFSAFGNKGKAVEPYTIERIIDRKGNALFEAKTTNYEVFTSQVAWYMTEMLQQVVTEGTGKAGRFPKALAGKTGTTEHTRAKGKIKDAWFVGYTPSYVTALWMGYDVSDEDHYLTGGSRYPTKLTKQILSTIDKEVALEDVFTKPKQVQALPKPIKLQEIKKINGFYTLGSFPFLKGKILWESDNEARVLYRIYEETEEEVKLLGEVPGNMNEFIIDRIPFLKKSYYYVVPFDPNTNQEGTPSKKVQLSL